VLCRESFYAEVFMMIIVDDEGGSDLDQDICVVWTRQEVVVISGVQRSWITTELRNDEEANPAHQFPIGRRISLPLSILEDTDRIVEAVNDAACNSAGLVGRDGKKVVDATQLLEVVKHIFSSVLVDRPCPGVPTGKEMIA
jgi:hypothetical protein